MIAEIGASSEFYTVNTQGMSASEPTRTKHIKALYAKLLGRPASSADLSAWPAGLSIQGVADAITVSAEFRSSKIRQWFSEILNRPASDSDVVYFRNLMNSGSTFEAVQSALYASKEYYYVLTGVATLSSCPGLWNFSDTSLDASDAVQACLDDPANRYSTIRFPPGVYSIGKQIRIQSYRRHMASFGLDENALPCGSSFLGITANADGSLNFSEAAKADSDAIRDTRCAAFVAAPGFIGNSESPNGLFFFELGNVDHIIFDGNRPARWNSQIPGSPYTVGQACQDKNIRYAHPEYFFTIRYGGSGNNGTKFTNSLVTQAVCASGMEIAGVTTRGAWEKLSRNIFAYNGRHTDGLPSHSQSSPEMFLGWADGLTIQYNDGVTIAENLFLGNTDSQLFIKECRNCLIEKNSFLVPTRMSNNFLYASHAAVALGAPMHQFEGPFDFTGSVIRTNMVDCGSLNGTGNKMGLRVRDCGRPDPLGKSG